MKLQGITRGPLDSLAHLEVHGPPLTEVSNYTNVSHKNLTFCDFLTTRDNVIKLCSCYCSCCVYRVSATQCIMLQVDKHGCTPLYSTAMAINPSPKVARLLVEAMWKYSGDETANNKTVMNSDVYR